MLINAYGTEPTSKRWLKPGTYHPPRKITVAIIDTVNIFTYSAIKKSANFSAEYSVWNPATSSVSASGRSNGTRFVSANAEIKKTTKPMNCGMMYHLKGEFICEWIIVVRSSEPASITTPMTEDRIARSYEII